MESLGGNARENVTQSKSNNQTEEFSGPGLRLSLHQVNEAASAESKFSSQSALKVRELASSAIQNEDGENSSEGVMTGSSVTELKVENRTLKTLLEQQQYDLTALQNEAELMRAELKKAKESQSQSDSRRKTEMEMLVLELAEAKKKRDTMDIHLKQALAENQDLRKLLEEKHGENQPDLSMVGRSNSVWNIEDLEAQLIESKMKIAGYEMELHVLRKERTLAEQRALQLQEELDEVKENSGQTPQPTPINNRISGYTVRAPSIAGSGSVQETKQGTRGARKSTSSLESEARVLELLDVTEDYYKLRVSSNLKAANSQLAGVSGDLSAVLDDDDASLEDETIDPGRKLRFANQNEVLEFKNASSRNMASLPAGPLPQIQSDKTTLPRNASRPLSRSNSGNYLVTKSSELPLVEPNLIMIPYGTDWAKDLFLFYQNALRKEMMDLYYICNSMSKRQYFLEQEDFELFSLWFEVFRYGVFVILQIQKTVLYPWLEERIDLTEIEPELEQSIRARRIDRISLIIDSIFDALEDTNRPHGERLELIIRLVDKISTDIIPYFKYELNALPNAVRAVFSPEDVEAFQMDALKYIRRVQNPHVLFLVLTDWIMNRELRHQLMTRYLTRSNYVTQMMWVRQFTAEKKKYRRDHSRTVRVFYRRWSDFQRSTGDLVVEPDSRFNQPRSMDRAPDSMKYDEVASVPSVFFNQLNSKAGHRSTNPLSDFQVNSSSNPL
uniref:Uncharacterized protein n=1 Tax=Timspurckia oligopyrenoides TaxID=708627 RepID=A0A7S0ZBM3_9RHOD|mmetsp:Transcript_11466/g.20737  ORF Transcript_11466/g.20737 Transcript_11466/m.20737 type:complete len:727 (+) Transcript_11466:77-2257(+)